VVEGGGLENR